VLSFENDARRISSFCQERCSLLRSVLASCHPEPVPTARERVRAELTTEITDAARRHAREMLKTA
jgi:hypothetical protein